jgi:diguanylate cyclase (GGDEF)-like protein/PAS domain S-box-containing protein
MSLNSVQICLELVEQSKVEFRKIAENAVVGMFLYNEYFIYVNEAFAKMTGYTSQELLSMHPWDLVEEKHKDAFKELVRKRIKGEAFSTIHNDIPLIRKDQEQLPVKVSAETALCEGSYVGIGIVIDVSDIVKKNQIIKVLIQALAQSDDIVFITDMMGKIEYVNEALLKIYGYKKEEVIDQTPAIFSSNKHTKAFYKELWDTILSGHNYHELIINKKKNGDIIYVDTKITPVKDDKGEKIAYFVATARDDTKRVLIEKKLKALATIDPLTQVANRYQLHHYFKDFIARKKRLEHPFSILMFDIDHFKNINDNYGHYVGDCILKSFSKLIVENIRTLDKFCRWGGEEFILLLDNTPLLAAVTVANKLNQLVSKTKFEGGYHITVSIGVAEYRGGESEEEAIERADQALYVAKKMGRDRVEYK